MEAEGIKTLLRPDNPSMQDRLFAQLGELRQKLWDNHFSTLSDDERKEFSQGMHPSQSHSRAPQAQPFVEEFEKRFASLGYIKKIALGFYHGDRLVISVSFSEDVPRKRWAQDLPAYFRGFEVKAGFDKKK